MEYDPYRLIISPKAARELAQIYTHIAKDSPQNARSMALRIMEALDTLPAVPHRAEVATQQSGLKYPVRSLVVRPYIIYFRAVDDDRVVRVLRIRHAARRRLRRFE